MTSSTFDAELGWHLAPFRADFMRGLDEDPLIPVLIQLQKGISAQDFAARAGSLLHVPELYTRVLPALDPAFQDLDHITALLSLRQYEALRDRSLIASLPIKEVTVSPPLPRRTRSEQADGWEAEIVERPRGPAAKNCAVIGIIDDGIAFAHERFREDGGSSRFEFFWMQDGSPPGPVGIFGPHISGRELRKTGNLPYGIDTLLERNSHAGLVDEDQLYRAAGVIDSETPLGHKAILWRRAHGTHVLDIACNTPLPSAVNSRLIGVQLPIATTGLPVTLTLAPYVYWGIWHILLRSLSVSTRLGCGPLPVVINLSYGLTTGPHDGLHSLERAIDDAASLWSKVFGIPVEVVIASGNNYLDRLHAVLSFPSGAGTVSIPWRVQPEDHTPSVVQIWLPPGPKPTSSRVKLRVIAPDGSTAGQVDETSNPHPLQQPLRSKGKVIGEVQYDFFGPPSGRGRMTIILHPTAQIVPVCPNAPCGLWRIEVDSVSLPPNAEVHAYVALDRAPYGYSQKGRQSYFDDPVYVRYDDAGRLVEVDNESIVKRAGSQNGLATGSRPSVVGGVLRKELVPARYSAGGPTLSSSRGGPDVLAVSDDSLVNVGVLGAGTRSGSVVAMNGTSVAAPMITRWVAGEIAAGRSGDRVAVRDLPNEPIPGPAPQAPEAERGGTGRVLLPSSSGRGAER